MTIYERFGRLQEDNDNLRVEYGKLLGVLGQVVAGEVAHERVTIDAAALSWAVLPLMPEPPLAPPTVELDEAA